MDGTQPPSFLAWGCGFAFVLLPFCYRAKALTRVVPEVAIPFQKRTLGTYGYRLICCLERELFHSFCV